MPTIDSKPKLEDEFKVREIRPADVPWAVATVSRHFGSSEVVSKGRLHSVRDLPGLLAERHGNPVGLLFYRPENRAIEVVVVISEISRRGVATQLLESLRRQAIGLGCHQMWLVTTNDNLDAIAFYRATGWRQVAVHVGAIRESRRLKPEIPEIGSSGIPIEDEIEFAIDL